MDVGVENCALGSLTLVEGTADIHRTGGCVDPRSFLDDLQKRQIPCSSWKLNADEWVV
jgi:hypothetical protein